MQLDFPMFVSFKHTVESRYIEVTGTAVYSSKYPRFDISV